MPKKCHLNGHLPRMRHVPTPFLSRFSAVQHQDAVSGMDKRRAGVSSGKSIPLHDDNITVAGSD
jgi:hypothetical protein